MSAKQRSESDKAGQHPRSSDPAAPEKKSKKQRSGDLGRALRTIYDDTVRETVPDDFLDLLGKLT